MTVTTQSSGPLWLHQQPYLTYEAMSFYCRSATVSISNFIAAPTMTCAPLACQPDGINPCRYLDA